MNEVNVGRSAATQNLVNAVFTGMRGYTATETLIALKAAIPIAEEYSARYEQELSEARKEVGLIENNS